MEREEEEEEEQEEDTNNMKKQRKATTYARRQRSIHGLTDRLPVEVSALWLGKVEYLLRVRVEINTLLKVY